MATSTGSKTRSTLAPLKCLSCNGPLVVVDAPSLVCAFCGAANLIPDAYREELRLKRDLDSATRNAAAQWMRLAHIKVPRWWFICTAIAPFVLMSSVLIILLTAALLRAVSGAALPGLLAYVWSTLIPLQLLAANVAMKNVLVSGATNVGAAFAAIPPTAQGEPPNCRQCGAPLSVQSDDLVVRCIYCEAESIVLLDDWAIETLRTQVVSARTSLAQAMSALIKYSRLARIETHGRTYLIAGLLILPLLWSFLESWNSSYWSLLIVLDVFVLSVCLFWNVREAFLPPVTLEELESVMGSSDSPSDLVQEPHSPGDRPKEPARVTGTRGWYDHASDKVNFIIPALVTLLFVAIQITVLKSH
jgi:hypothetical protein